MGGKAARCEPSHRAVRRAASDGAAPRRMARAHQSVQSMWRAWTHEADVQRRDKTVIKPDDDFPLRVQEVDGYKLIFDQDDQVVTDPFVNLMFNADRVAAVGQKVMDQVRAALALQEGLRVLHGLVPR